MLSKKGRFIISLDYEQYWGVFSNSDIEEYVKSNIVHVHSVFDKTLDLFSKYDVFCTIAIVGLLFLDSLEELGECKKFNIDYKKNFCPYTRIRSGITLNERIHLSNYKLLNKLKESNHEIGSHTFSHYFCNAEGQSLENFELDLKLYKEFNRYFEAPKTLVFPRNQINRDYFEAIKTYGFTHLRVNDENSNLYDYTRSDCMSINKKIKRFIDRYLNISGHNPSITIVENGIILNTHSRFLSPYNSTLPFLEPLKVKRILNDMTYCAKNNLDYHLWWHPHNFGDGLKMLPQLERILTHYKRLNNDFGFQSTKMEEL